MFKTISDFFNNMQTAERVVLWMLALAVIIVVAVYVVRKVRSGFSPSMMSTSDYLPKFEQMRESGDLNDEEFKKLKKTISQKTLLEHTNDDQKAINELNQAFEENLDANPDKK